MWIQRVAERLIGIFPHEIMPLPVPLDVVREWSSNDAPFLQFRIGEVFGYGQLQIEKAVYVLSAADVPDHAALHGVHIDSRGISVNVCKEQLSLEQNSQETRR